MAYGESNGHVTDDVTPTIANYYCCEAVRSLSYRQLGFLFGFAFIWPHKISIWNSVQRFYSKL